MHQKVSLFPSSKGAENRTPGLRDNPSAEQIALQRVLQSRTFSRSPRLSRILDYVCRKYFARETDQLKEYTIAVELFGRSENFQSRDDSSIRVDMNRLRKQLHKYYRAEGKQDPLVITIPSGQYAPVFSPREAKPASGAVAACEERPTETEKSGSRWLILVVLGLVLAVLAMSAWLYYRPVGPAPGAVRNGGRSLSAGAAPPPGPAIRILAGNSRETYIDQFGNVWLGDRYFIGGAPVDSPIGLPLISAQREATETTSAREGNFSYHIPLPPGVYELRLYFMEWGYGSGQQPGGETSRIFDVFINGNRLLPRFDIVADAGGARIPDIKVFTDVSPASDGALHLMFTPLVSKAIVSGIEILPGIPGRIRPVRIACRSAAYTAPDGTVWSADRFYRGGRIAERHTAISGTSENVLYQSERYGRFSYTIPVANQGFYTVILGFAETYFGAGNPGEASEDERRFNVVCNGETLLKDFNVAQAAGGEANRAITRVFEHIEPSPQGKIVLDFVPVQNYACVNTIQVLSE